MFDADKPRMIGLPYGEKNIAEKFNRLSRVHERHRQTTDTIASQRRCDIAWLWRCL